MSVSLETSRVQYNCDGILTVYTYPFEILEDDDLLAVKADSLGNETPLVLNTDYTVTGAGSPTGGTLVLTAASICPSGYTLTILRNIELTQETDYIDGDAFSAESFEAALDKMALIQQQQKEIGERSLRLKKSSPTSPPLPSSSLATNVEVPITAGKAIGWNSAGTALTTYNVGDLTTIDFDNCSNYSDFNTAIATIGATEQTLICNTAQTLTANIVIPANIHFVILKGGSIASAGFTLGINGPLEAGLYQAFSGFSAGDVTFGSNSVKEVIPQWFGAKADGLTDDSIAIQVALTAAGVKGNIFFPYTSAYYRATNLTPLQGQGLHGVWLGSWIKYTGGTTPIFNLTNGNISFENLQISNSAPGGVDAGCIKWSGAINSLRLRKVWLADAYYGLKTAGGGEISINDSVLESFDNVCANLQGSYETRINNSYLGSANEAILTGLNGATRCKGLSITNSEFANNRLDAIALSSIDGVSIIGSIFNSNGQAIDNTYNSISLYDSTGISIIGNSGVADAVGSGKDVAYHVYFYANTTVDKARIFGNTWHTPKTAEIFYKDGVIAATGDHSFNTPNIVYNDTIPTLGTWKAGDICFNTAPAGGSPPGWVCTVAGTPGTWVAMPNL